MVCVANLSRYALTVYSTFSGGGDAVGAADKVHIAQLGDSSGLPMIHSRAA